jgi:hypothetical protein
MSNRPQTRQEQRASEYGRQREAMQRHSLAHGIERVAWNLAVAFQFLRKRAPFDAGAYWADARAAAAEHLYYCDEYEPAMQLVNAARGVLAMETMRLLYDPTAMLDELPPARKPAKRSRKRKLAELRAALDEGEASPVVEGFSLGKVIERVRATPKGSP